MESFRCQVKSIRFHNPETGFAIVKAVTATGSFLQDIVAVGTFAELQDGMSFQLTGDWTTHPTYGKQFKVDSALPMLPQTLHGMEAFLSSGLIKGVGPVYGKRIVETFKEDTFQVLDDHPERLLSVKGIGTDRLNRIIRSWEEHREVRNIIVYLQSVGASTRFAVKIYKKFGKHSIERIKKDPYCLTDIWGIGFQTADSIAKHMGIPASSISRCKSGILYTLEYLSGEGHVYATIQQLLERAMSADILNLSDSTPVVSALRELLEQKRLIRERQYPDAVYLRKYHDAEVSVTEDICRLFGKKRKEAVLADSEISRIEQALGITYDECQKEALCRAASESLLVLTGGPGTGKSTTIHGILHYFRERKKRILLAAPTGRAAQRMSEITGREAVTIHRLLEYGPEGFGRNESNPLEGDLLVVDESSMIDIVLMSSLLKAVPQKMKLILVGDVDQLPSVGPGCVLRDCIQSQAVPVVTLTKIFRQAQNSDIVMNAHRINCGQPIRISNKSDSDFFWCVEDEPAKIQERIVEYVTNKLPNHYHVPAENIQVLAPMRNGLEGVRELNQKLQEAINPDSDRIPFHDGTLRVNDKVMQLRNNYNKNVFNGDIGYVKEIQEDAVIINFSGQDLSYERSELEEITLAYCCTIHKSQGSEYPIVVMPVSTSHWIMLERNLFYTAVTRAKKIFVMVGSKKALHRAIDHVTSTKRNTMLQERLRIEAGR